MQRGEEIQDEEGRPREGFTKDQEGRNDNLQGTRYWREEEESRQKGINNQEPLRGYQQQPY